MTSSRTATTITFHRWLDPETRASTDNPAGSILERVDLPARWIPCHVCGSAEPCPRCAGTGSVLVPDREMGDSDVIEQYFRQLEVEHARALPGFAALDRQALRQAGNFESWMGAPYDVILVDDDLHSYYYVTHMLELVFGYDNDIAYDLTDITNGSNKVVVFTGRLETALILCDQINKFGPDLRLPQSVGAMTAYVRPRLQHVEDDPLLRAMFPVQSREQDRAIANLTIEELPRHDGEDDGNDADDQDPDDDDGGLLAC